MKKKLVFIGIILLALVLTTGTFAYTYTNYGTTTLDATIADAVWTTYQPSASQPNWNSILPEGEYDSDKLRPDAPGDDTELPTQYPGSGEHWDKVDDPHNNPDDGDTYVSTQTSKNWERDLYNLNNYTGAGGEETITGVTVYFRYAAGGDYNVRAMAALKTNGQVYEGPTLIHNGTDWVTESWQNTTNPNTGEPWTWEEINDLQAGVTIKGNSKTKPALCTQVYVLVNYEFATTQGEVPPGDLYDITPHEDYTGDLLVKLYLTNTASLLKAYQYLNMKVYMANTLEADKTPNYQVLSIETGVVLFNIEGGSAGGTYIIEITGGSYRLISDDSDEWGAGWSIEPEFYCEVGQR
ncbi:MAG: hypothetical protein KAW90_05300 [Dehalococcoidales bacterium]|nr:hypothetical protein [Dehalococcoidales bacterium]